MAKPQSGPAFRLSNSTLQMLRGGHPCPRCFWDHIRLGVERPRGAFPSIPIGVDREVKAFTDAQRPELPPSLAEGLPKGTKLWGTAEEIRKVRAWQTGMVIGLRNDVQVVTALDDLLVHADGSWSPLDAKTNANPPKPEDLEVYYSTQGDIYSLALEQAGRRPSGWFYLWCWWPGHGTPDTRPVLYDKLVKIRAQPVRALALIEEAFAVLRGDRPALGADCEWCTYRGQMPAPPCSPAPPTPKAAGGRRAAHR